MAPVRDARLCRVEAVDQQRAGAEVEDCARGRGVTRARLSLPSPKSVGIWMVMYSSAVATMMTALRTVP